MELKTFKTLQCNITRIFDVNSSNRMFYSMHNFIIKTHLFNLYPGIFQTLTYSEPEVYSEPCQTSKMEFFQTLFSQYQLFTFSTFLNESIFFSNTIWPRGPETVNFDIPTLYLKTIRKKQGVSKKMPCCHFLLIVI